MSNKIIGLVMLSGILSMLSGIVEMVYFGEAETSRLTILLTAPRFEDSLGVLGTIASSVGFGWTWLVNLFGMLTFDYAMFQGEWQIVRYILFIPVGIGIITGIIALVRGTNA